MTLGHYVLIEIHFLHSMIYIFNNILIKNDSKPVFDFDEEQISAMTNLIQSL